MSYKPAFLAMTLLIFMTLSCAKSHPSEVAKSRWKGCKTQLAKLDSTLLTSNLSLPNHLSQISLAKEGLEPVKALDSLFSLLANFDQSCEPLGVRAYEGFRVYQLAYFTRRLTEYSVSLEEIREQHLFLIGDLKQITSQNLGLLNNSKKVYSELLNDSTHYMIFQNY